MSRFQRSGHFRVSKNGHEHWVNGTTVERSDWDRYSYGNTAAASHRQTPPPRRDAFYDRYPEFENVRRRSACFVNPNAHCPVCGESVYYYQNEHGSRVFFDELGPPWPKHGCTDTGLHQPSIPRTDGRFEARKPSAILEIVLWHDRNGFDVDTEFAKKNGASPWPLATIAKRMKSGKRVFLILKPVQVGRSPNVFVSCKSLPKCCKEGFVVALQKGKISFIDTASMEPKEAPIKRFRSASAFVDAMIE